MPDPVLAGPDGVVPTGRLRLVESAEPGTWMEWPVANAFPADCARYLASTERARVLPGLRGPIW